MRPTEHSTQIVKSHDVLFLILADPPAGRMANVSEHGRRALRAGKNGSDHKSQKVAGLDDALCGHDC